MKANLKMKDELKSEKQIVASCRAWLKRNDWEPFTIYTGGIPTYNGQRVKNPVAGIPDSINFYSKAKITLWIEYKSSIGKVKEDQRDWHKRLTECNNKVIIVNSLESLKIQIKEIIELHEKTQKK